MDKKEQLLAVYRRLKKEYPRTETFLKYSTPFELLIAVILSAQTTDAQVNKITPSLFKAFPSSRALMKAGREEVENIIHSTGYFRVKAKNIISAAAAVTERFGGRVPQEMDALLTIPGVGRKSANVVRAHCFDKPAVIVDTHFARVVRRLGLTDHKKPEKIEKDIAGISSPDMQADFSMMINVHGRRCCFSRNPACDSCVITSLCFFAPNN